MDKNDPILFYENTYYSFSNFSSFAINWKGYICATTEHAYQSEKFDDKKIKEEIINASSALNAMLIAKENKDKYKKDWYEIKLKVMKEILQEKIKQHPYIKEKLLQTNNREIIENSPKDDFWGWGPNKNGANHLGKLWMEIREEIKH
jgi:ribA/ribD-fused uncharacterized protein